MLYGDRVGKMVRSLRSVTVNMGQLEMNRKTSGTSSLHHISGQRPPKYSWPIDGTYSAITLDIVTIIMLHLFCFQFFLSHPRRVQSPLPYLSPNISYNISLGSKLRQSELVTVLCTFLQPPGTQNNQGVKRGNGRRSAMRTEM